MMLWKRVIRNLIYFIIFVGLLYLLIYLIGFEKLSKVNENTILAALMTMFVFGTGLFVNQIQTLIRQYKKDKYLKTAILTNLVTINEGIELQLSNFYEIVEVLKNEHLNSFRLIDYSELKYFEINQKSSEDLYRIFIENTNGRQKNNILDLENLRRKMRFIEFSRENIMTESIRLLTSAKDEFNNAIKEAINLQHFTEEQNIEYIKKEEVDQWFLEFKDVMIDTRDLFNDDKGVFEVNEELNNRIHPEFIKLHENYLEDPRSQELSNMLRKIIDYITMANTICVSMIGAFSSYIEHYEDARMIISDYIVKNDFN